LWAHFSIKEDIKLKIFLHSFSFSDCSSKCINSRKLSRRTARSHVFGCLSKSKSRTVLRIAVPYARLYTRVLAHTYLHVHSFRIMHESSRIYAVVTFNATLPNAESLAPSHRIFSYVTEKIFTSDITWRSYAIFYICNNLRPQFHYFKVVFCSIYIYIYIYIYTPMFLKKRHLTFTRDENIWHL